MQVGDRVMVKAQDGIANAGCYGYIDGKSGEVEWDWSVSLDGHRKSVWYKSDNLLPVEVMVLEGEVLIFDDSWEGVARVGDKYLSDVLNHGDTARITIERVKG